jgi:hypothetical protein
VLSEILEQTESLPLGVGFQAAMATVHYDRLNRSMHSDPFLMA